MKRVIKASQDTEKRFILEYGTAFNHRTRSFYNMAELLSFVRSHVFADSRFFRAYEKRPIEITPTYVSHVDANDRKLQNQLFDNGIAKFSDWEEDQKGSEEVEI